MELKSEGVLNWYNRLDRFRNTRKDFFELLHECSSFHWSELVTMDTAEKKFFIDALIHPFKYFFETVVGSFEAVKQYNQLQHHSVVSAGHAL